MDHKVVKAWVKEVKAKGKEVTISLERWSAHPSPFKIDWTDINYSDNF